MRVAASTFQVAAAVDLDDFVVVIGGVCLHDVLVAPIHAVAGEVGLHDVVLAEMDQLAGDVGLEDHVAGYAGHDHVVATRHQVDNDVALVLCLQYV